MVFSVLSYNLLFSNALNEAINLVKKHQPDILCFQEYLIDNRNKNRFLSGRFRLSGNANSFIKLGKIYGLATFYNQKKFTISAQNNERIPHTLFDWFRFIRNFFKKRIKREFLKTTFKINGSKKSLTVFNVHLTAEATNEERINQIKQILKATKKIKTPLIIVGDFNYVPYRRKKLERLFKEYGFKEATANIDYTFFAKKNLFLYGLITKFLVKVFSKIFPEKFKLDFVFYRKLKLIRCQKIESKISDHYPLLTSFKV